MGVSSRSAKSRYAVGFALVAGFLAVASIAWACTVFKGKMTITASTGGTKLPTSTGTPGGTATAVGSGTGMTLCSVTQGANVASISGTFDIDVVAEACGGNDGSLAEGDYDVNFFPNYPAFPSIPDCMSIAQGGVGIPIGEIAVDSAGSGSGGPYGLPAMAAVGGRASICITNQIAALGGPSPAPSPPEGMAAPIYVI